MIFNKKQLNEFILQDAKACGRKKIKAKFYGDEIWKFQLCLRKREYYSRNSSNFLQRIIEMPKNLWFHYRFHKLSIKLGFSIPLNVFDKGLSIVHYGTIVVSKNAVIGKNCRIHEGVTIGATNGEEFAPKIGDNVFIGSGAKIIGDIKIADNVAIAVNAVVVKNIEESGTTWGGVPSRKISDHGALLNLSKMLDLK